MNDIPEKVYEDLRKEFGLYGEALRETAESLLDETFEDISRVHDWRNYIDLDRSASAKEREEFIEYWKGLHPVTRYIKFVKAWHEAYNEEWD